ncbi:hypothetical protein ECANGB1_2379 [Enterospora canceri]|uniref:Uncharacterized protein n=1 Tax=Enterospora canceri TaxID=1081671 RepID=A0A1Y1S3Q1_9MICR|nr:hypothetical protein ECANGB1_2379 [Enterospora canceri]
MLGPFNYTGVASCDTGNEKYWVQVFAKEEEMRQPDKTVRDSGDLSYGIIDPARSPCTLITECDVGEMVRPSTFSQIDQGIRTKTVTVSGAVNDKPQSSLRDKLSRLIKEANAMTVSQPNNQSSIQPAKVSTITLTNTVTNTITNTKTLTQVSTMTNSSSTSTNSGAVNPTTLQNNQPNSNSGNGNSNNNNNNNISANSNSNSNNNIIPELVKELKNELYKDIVAEEMDKKNKKNDISEMIQDALREKDEERGGGKNGPKIDLG